MHTDRPRFGPICVYLRLSVVPFGRALAVSVLSLALILWIAGCGRRQETVTPPPAKAWKQEPVASTPSSQEEEPANEAHEPDDSQSEPADTKDPAGAGSKDPSAADSEDPSGVRVYNTGDCDDWPSYELPLVIEIEIPEIPEQLTKLAEPIPNEQE
jgi:hypothetical protein